MFSKLWPSSPGGKQGEPAKSTPEKAAQEAKQELEHVETRLESIPAPLLVLVAFSLGIATSTGGAILYARYGRRIKNSDWITPDFLTKKRWIRGVVTSVGDADNFRLFHTPSFGGWRRPLKFRRIPTGNKELKDQTVHIRLAGVDAPEAAHFGKPGQPYATESLAWLRQKIMGKPVYCQLIRRDQYMRVVANVHLTPRFLPGAFFYGKSVSLEMLRAGWVTTYEQAGAEYGSVGKEEYLRVEGEARAARRGMWADGTAAETPAEYKRRHASPATESKADKVRSTTSHPSSEANGWLSRLFKRK